MRTMARILAVGWCAVAVGCAGASETNRTLVKQRIEAGLQAEADKLDAVGRVQTELVDQLNGLKAQAAALNRSVPDAEGLAEQLEGVARTMAAARARMEPRRQALVVYATKMPEKKLAELDALGIAEHATAMTSLAGLLTQLETLRAALSQVAAAAGAQADEVSESEAQSNLQRARERRWKETAAQREDNKVFRPHTD